MEREIEIEIVTEIFLNIPTIITDMTNIRNIAKTTVKTATSTSTITEMIRIAIIAMIDIFVTAK